MNPTPKGHERWSATLEVDPGWVRRPVPHDDFTRYTLTTLSSRPLPLHWRDAQRKWYRARRLENMPASADEALWRRIGEPVRRNILQVRWQDEDGNEVRT